MLHCFPLTSCHWSAFTTSISSVSLYSKLSTTGEHLPSSSKTWLLESCRWQTPPQPCSIFTVIMAFQVAACTLCLDSRSTSKSLYCIISFPRSNFIKCLPEIWFKPAYSSVEDKEFPCHLSSKLVLSNLAPYCCWRVSYKKMLCSVISEKKIYNSWLYTTDSPKGFLITATLNLIDTDVPYSRKHLVEY